MSRRTLLRRTLGLLLIPLMPSPVRWFHVGRIDPDYPMVVSPATYNFWRNQKPGSKEEVQLAADMADIYNRCIGGADL